ncbi:conserved hypothetical protein [Vibrio aestuarianus]|uniref:hypothetical protein n=1 Tax=Vibrio aestuarianus TaxID=28171 RepID=UPI00145606AD|nr:hypothetical protein [Vibrio aestuarianus]NLS51992.1 hypothetical protein [Vibrio aestuarianus subsp. francensis]NLS67250.1 hypothetical protein [Vibrio aestuarianus subsp. francensis]CAH8233890.1 conserved hypothetical protein [Vibrio aestuarianus]CAH8233944.1 conserved hypothetical protein [Vibrio aestuarianus]CAH8234071.1 conserved hypothetical protein [Vibrio aestuarianus]
MINLRLFKNPFRLSQLAENTERILNEIVDLTSKTHPTHNAALSGEQRTDQVAALHRKTLYLTHSKTATR